MMDYMSIARIEGYEIVFTGIGMAYVKYSTIKLTETMDIEHAKQELMKIGQAIANDWTRQYIEKKG